MGPLKTPKPVEANFNVHQVAGETSYPLGFTRSVRLIGVLASRLHVIDAGCKRLSSRHYGVQWLAVIVTAWPHKLELHQPTSTSAGTIVLRASRVTCHEITSRSFRLLHLIRLHTRCNSRPQCIYYQHAVSTPIPWGKFGAWTTHVWSQDVIGRCVSKNRVCTKTCRSGSAISQCVINNVRYRWGV